MSLGIVMHFVYQYKEVVTDSGSFILRDQFSLRNIVTQRQCSRIIWQRRKKKKQMKVSL